MPNEFWHPIEFAFSYFEKHSSSQNVYLSRILLYCTSWDLFTSEIAYSIASMTLFQTWSWCSEKYQFPPLHKKVGSSHPSFQSIQYSRKNCRALSVSSIYLKEYCFSFTRHYQQSVLLSSDSAVDLVGYRPANQPKLVWMISDFLLHCKCPGEVRHPLHSHSQILLFKKERWVKRVSCDEKCQPSLQILWVSEDYLSWTKIQSVLWFSWVFWACGRVGSSLFANVHHSTQESSRDLKSHFQWIHVCTCLSVSQSPGNHRVLWNLQLTTYFLLSSDSCSSRALCKF